MTLEFNGVAGWIYSILLGSDIIANAVRVHPTERIPQIYERRVIIGAELPYMLFIRKSGYNIRGSGARKVFERSEYDIKVVFDGNDFTTALRPVRDPNTYNKQTDAQGNDILEPVDIIAVGNELDSLFYRAQIYDDPIVAGSTVVAAIQRDYIDPTDQIPYNEVGITIHVMAYPAP